jgi:outer membrane lipoprotein SlyB
METKAIKSMHPLMMITGVAVILFSLAGVAAIMGWIPTSIGHPSDTVAAEKLTTNTAKPPVTKSHTAPVKVATHTAAKVECAECGVIESVRQIQHSGEGSGLGAVGGAVVGGLLGNQVGGGHGKEVMTVVGAVGGAVAGNQVEKRVKSTSGYEITVRFDNGTTRVISATNAPAWRPGDKVKIINDTIQSNA